MKTLALMIAAGSMVAFAGGAMAGKDEAPGQDRVCVTTASDDSGADATILTGKWLPRKAADKQLEKEAGHAKGDNPAIYDYANDAPTPAPGLSPQETCDRYPIGDAEG